MANPASNLGVFLFWWLLNKNDLAGQWWCMLLIPALGRQRQEDLWVPGQASLQRMIGDSQGYTENSCLKKNSNQPTKQKDFIWLNRERLHIRDWRDSLAVKSTDCSSRGEERERGDKEERKKGQLRGAKIKGKKMPLRLYESTKSKPLRSLGMYLLRFEIWPACIKPWDKNKDINKDK